MAGNEKITATETWPEMPDFLIRQPDNTFLHPEPWGPIKPLRVRELPPAEDLTKWDEDRLYQALDINMTVAARQPILRELHRRVNKRRTNERIAALKERLADNAD